MTSNNNNKYNTTIENMSESSKASLSSSSNHSNNGSAQGSQQGGEVSLARGVEGHNMTPLRDSFQPSENDVICARGSRVFNYIGNCRFRVLVAAHLAEYNAANSRIEKTVVLAKVVSIVRMRCAESGSHGGFVKKMPNNHWYEVGDFVAREKTSQAFRDILHEKYSSSNENKRRKRNSKSDLLSSLSAPMFSTTTTARSATTVFAVPSSSWSGEEESPSKQENPLIEALRNAKCRAYASTTTTAANSSGGLYGAVSFSNPAASTTTANASFLVDPVQSSSWSQSCRNFEWNAGPSETDQEEPVQQDAVAVNHFTTFLGHQSFPSSNSHAFGGGGGISMAAAAADHQRKANNELLLIYMNKRFETPKNNNNNNPNNSSVTQQLFAKFLLNKGNHSKDITSNTSTTTTTTMIQEQQKIIEKSISTITPESSLHHATTTTKELQDYVRRATAAAAATGNNNHTNHNANDDSMLLEHLHESLGYIDMSSDPFEPSPVSV